MMLFHKVHLNWPNLECIIESTTMQCTFVVILVVLMAKGKNSFNDFSLNFNSISVMYMYIHIILDDWFLGGIDRGHIFPS